MTARILLLTAVSPHPPTTGGAQRTTLLHRALAQLGEVELILLRDSSEFSAADLHVLESTFGLIDCVPRRKRGAWWPWSMVRPLFGARLDRIAHHLGDAGVEYRADPPIAAAVRRAVGARGHHVIVVRYLSAAAKADAFELAPLLLDVDDLDLEVIASRLASPAQGGLRDRLRRVLDGWRLRRLETVVGPLLRRCAGHWIAKEADRATPALERATLLPNIPFSSPVVSGATIESGAVPPSSPPSSMTLLTVGTLTHRPNADGIDRFVERSWPQVRAAVSAARLRIVGSGLSDEQRRRWSAVDGVDVIGFVDDIAPEYAAAAATLCAVHAGGGTNIKIAESYARGRAAVIAGHSLRGYEHILEDRASVWVGRSDAELAEGCIALLRDPARRDAMATAGRRACVRELSFERFAGAVRSLVHSLDPEERWSSGAADRLPGTEAAATDGYRRSVS